jgi:hypothetical protein
MYASFSLLERIDITSSLKLVLEREMLLKAMVCTGMRCFSLLKQDKNRTDGLCAENSLYKAVSNHKMYAEDDLDNFHVRRRSDLLQSKSSDSMSMLEGRV